MTLDSPTTFTKNRPESRFVSDYRMGSGWRWRACLSARRVVERGDLKKVSKELALNDATVKNMAIAAAVYRILRNYAGRTRNSDKLHTIRRTLTYTHFVIVGRRMISSDIPIDEVFRSLETAANTNATTRDLLFFLLGEFGTESDNADMWKPALHRTIRELDSLIDNYATPYEIKQRIRDIKQELAAYL